MPPSGMKKRGGPRSATAKKVAFVVVPAGAAVPMLSATHKVGKVPAAAAAKVGKDKGGRSAKSKGDELEQGKKRNKKKKFDSDEEFDDDL